MNTSNRLVKTTDKGTNTENKRIIGYEFSSFRIIVFIILRRNQRKKSYRGYEEKVYRWSWFWA